MNDDALAEDLRQVIGELVRAVRVADTMPSAEAALLGHLDRGGPQTTADLAQLRRVTHQAAARTVKELLHAGLVRSEPHPSDGRKVVLHITVAGRARLTRERAHRADWLNAAIREELSSDEQQLLRECVPLLGRLTTRITGR